MVLSVTQLVPVVQDIVITQINWLNGTNQREQHVFNPQGDIISDSLSTYQAAAQVALFFSLKDIMEPETLLNRANTQYWAECAAERLSRDDAKIVFSSGGTSGKTKHITHELSALWRESAVWASHYQDLEHCYRCVPCHHIYGFIWTLLLPNLLHIGVTDGRERFPQTIISTPEVALIVTIPDALPIWQSVATIPDNKHIVVSTAPCEWESLLATVNTGYRSITQVYGATETGAVGYRRLKDGDNQISDYTLMPYLQFNGEKLQNETTTLDVQDALRFSTPCHFSVEGRLDNQIQLRGRNVDIDHLTKKMLLIDGIAECSIRQDTTANGEYLKCLVVPCSEVLPGTILTRIKDQPELGALIGSIQFADHLPKNALGKLIDWTSAFSELKE